MGVTIWIVVSTCLIAVYCLWNLAELCPLIEDDEWDVEEFDSELEDE